MGHYTKIGGALRLRQRSAERSADKKNSLLRVLERAVHEVWYPTLVALRACPPWERYEPVLAAWEAFGAAMELIESDEKARIEKETRHLCAWRECEYHTQNFPGATRQCAGCRQVVRTKD